MRRGGRKDAPQPPKGKLLLYQLQEDLSQHIRSVYGMERLRKLLLILDIRLLPFRHHMEPLFVVTILLIESHIHLFVHLPRPILKLHQVC